VLVQEEMFARWVSAVQWGSGTRANAAAVVWRADSRVESGDSGLETGEYGVRFRLGEKKGWFRFRNSLAVVYDLASARRRGAIYSSRDRFWRIGALWLGFSMWSYLRY
jgi:hypothetical protein